MTTPHVLQVGEALTAVVERVISDVFTAVDLFTDVAFGDPFFLSLVLVLLGGLVIGAASAVFGGISLGGVIGAFFRLAE